MARSRPRSSEGASPGCLAARHREGAPLSFAHAIFPDEPATLNEWNRQLAAAHPRIVPFGTCHPETPEPLSVLGRCLDDYGFPGMKFHPFVQRFMPWERQFFPLWERIARAGRILVFHTGFEAFYGSRLPVSNTVRTLNEIARRWKVSKSEALRRAIRAVASQVPEESQDALQALDTLQDSLGGTAAKTRAWVQAARAERQASSRRREALAGW